MKIIKYHICTIVNYGTEEAPVWEEVLTPVEVGWNKENEEIARMEAYNGQYSIEDDGQTEPIPVETTDDVLNTLLGVMG